MKVVHFIEHFYPRLGGGEVHVWDLVRSDIKQFHHVVLTDAFPGYPHREKIGERCEAIRFSPLDYTPPPSLKYLQNPTYPFRLFTCLSRFVSKMNWLKNNQYDILHVHGPGVAINLNPADRILGIPFLTKLASFRNVVGAKIFSFHSYMSNFTQSKVDMMQELRFIREFENIICVDAHINSQVEEHCKREKLKRDIRFIPHTINTANFPFQEIGERKLLKLLFVGRLAREKGVETLLKLINKKLPFLKICLVVADGEYKVTDFRRLVDGNENVEFHPNVSNEEVAKHIHNSDVLFNPVQAKGISRVCMEAMACGRPVIMFREGDRYPIQDGKTGFLMEPGDLDGLFSFLERLSGDRDLLSRTGEAAAKIIREKFDNQHGFRRIFDFYEDILSAH